MIDETSRETFVTFTKYLICYRVHVWSSKEVRKYSNGTVSKNHDICDVHHEIGWREIARPIPYRKCQQLMLLHRTLQISRGSYHYRHGQWGLCCDPDRRAPTAQIAYVPRVCAGSCWTEIFIQYNSDCRAICQMQSSRSPIRIEVAIHRCFSCRRLTLLVAPKLDISELVYFEVMQRATLVDNLHGQNTHTTG